jgi:hypothetical protein
VRAAPDVWRKSRDHSGGGMMSSVAQKSQGAPFR